MLQEMNKQVIHFTGNRHVPIISKTYNKLAISDVSINGLAPIWYQTMPRINDDQVLGHSLYGMALVVKSQWVYVSLKCPALILVLYLASF